MNKPQWDVLALGCCIASPPPTSMLDSRQGRMDSGSWRREVLADVCLTDLPPCALNLRVPFVCSHRGWQKGAGFRQGLSLSPLFVSSPVTALLTDPSCAGRAHRMAELLPLLSWAPPLAKNLAQDTPVPPDEWQSQQPQAGRTEGLVSESWRFLDIPAIHITPSSDGESPPCTPVPRRLQRRRTLELKYSTQDR